jgi:hypothetical protein
MKSRFNLICLLLMFSHALPATAWAGGPWHAADNNTAGWQYMTPDERIEHQRKMRSFNTYEACRAYQDEHHSQMAERALRAGVTLDRHAGSGCEQLRRQGKYL